MSSDFYALFKQPQQPQQDPARKKKGGGKKHDNQFKMKADGTLGKPDKQVTKKRKNSVIEIEDDEDDRPDKHGSLRKHRSPQKKQLTEKNPPKAIHPLFTSNYSQRGGSRGHGTAVKQIHARHPLISESHVQPDSDRAVYVDIGEVPFKRRAGAEKLLEPRESWASTSRFRLTSLNEPTAVPAPAPTSHTRKHNANTNSDNSNTNPPQSSGYALAMSSTLLPHALRPQRPSDVLHNATLATYLSAWMANLALGSPRWEDVRTLQEERKTRKRQCDWIVDDMFDFDLDFDAPPQPSHLPTLPQTGHPDSIESNCILIQGPPGCGKTASVYASAQALGWDVFEVFPGIKRSGKEVLDLVGAVGENHIIGRSKKSLIDQQRMKTHRQSVILFEEVDVLFEEDRGFWGAVQALVQYSKRPVVLTCNDASTIPSNTLTLQATLEFRRPPHDTVRRYLSESGVSIPLELLNGVARPPQAIEDEKSWLIDSGGGLYGEHFDAGCDLRQALMQVHVDTKSGGENSKKHHSSPKKHSSKPFNSLKEAMLKTEALSFVDAHVAQPLWRSMEVGFLVTLTPHLTPD